MFVLLSFSKHLVIMTRKTTADGTTNERIPSGREVEASSSTSSVVVSGFVLSNLLPVTTSQRKYIAGLVEGLPKPSRHVFWHIIRCHSSNVRKDVPESEKGIPLPSVVLEKNFGGNSRILVPLVQRNLIQKTGNWGEGRAQRYLLCAHIAQELKERAPQNTQEAAKPRVNLFWESRKPVSYRTEWETFHALLPREAVQVLTANGCRVLWGPHVDDAIEALPSTAQASGAKVRDTIGGSLREGRYTPAYQQDRTGRITELGTGIQGCPRALRPAFLAMPGVVDCDIRSSHICGLLQMAEDVGAETSWLHNYISNANAKEEMAEALGVPTATWKSILYAFLCGSHLATGYGQNFSSVSGYLAEYCNDQQDLDAKTEHLKVLLEPLNDILVAVKRHLKVKNQSQGMLVNACGGYFSEGTPSDALSHMLQGLEAAFIHCLCIFAGRNPNCGFSPMVNTHDGLICEGFVSQEAIDWAKKESGFRHATLKQTPFLNA